MILVAGDDKDLFRTKLDQMINLRRVGAVGCHNRLELSSALGFFPAQVPSREFRPQPLEQVARRPVRVLAA